MATKLQKHIDGFTPREKEMYLYLRSLFDNATKDLVYITKHVYENKKHRLEIAYTRQTQAAYCLQVLGIDIFQVNPEDETGEIRLLVRLD